MGSFTLPPSTAFQSTPDPKVEGNMGTGPVRPGPVQVSIRPRPEGRGKLDMVYLSLFGPAFQSAPDPKVEGNTPRPSSAGFRQSFNPPPTRRSRETRRW